MRAQAHATIFRALTRPTRDLYMSVAIVFGVAFVAFTATWRLGVFVATAAVAVLVLVSVMCAKPDAATGVVVFALYTNTPSVAYSFEGVPIYIAGSVLALILIPFLYYLIFEHRPVVFTRPFRLMLVYLAVSLASAAVSRDAAQSAGRISAYLAEGIAIYFLVTNTIRSQKSLRVVTWALVLAGMLLGALSTYQGVTRKYQQNFGGLAQVQTVDEDTGERLAQPRAAGPIGETNRYAQLMLVLLPLALFRWWDERSILLRAASAVAVLVIVSAIAFTFSRGAGVAAILMLLLLRVLGYLKTKHLIVAIAAAGLVCAAIAPLYLLRFSRLSSATDIRSADSAMRGRATENLAALRIFLGHPLLGVGPGQAPVLIQVYGNADGYRRLDTSRRAHNMYLEELAETGVVGFLTFIAIVASTLIQLERARRYCSEFRSEEAHLITGILVAIATYMFSALFLHLAFIRYYYLLLALGGVTAHLLGDQASQSRLQSAPGIVMLSGR
jgi:putative inorganic carbon (HCO3(-)) transporter